MGWINSGWTHQQHPAPVLSSSYRTLSGLFSINIPVPSDMRHTSIFAILGALLPLTSAIAIRSSVTYLFPGKHHPLQVLSLIPYPSWSRCISADIP